MSVPNYPPNEKNDFGGYEGWSWIGLDGLNDIGHDVLQTGVGCTIFEGTPYYFTWYEWWPYAMDYPLRGNIGVAVKPGDIVRGIVQYNNINSPPYSPLNGGSLLLENVSTGKYFTTTLEAPAYPPPGATPTGGSAEWVMETPEFPGYSALPRFAQVNFTNAFALGPSTARCRAGLICNEAYNPRDGVTGEIQRVSLNEVLTSSTVGNMTVTIKYAG